MTPLPAALAPDAPLLAWRLDAAVRADSWDSGIGAELAGGRWNPKGFRAVYCSLDPATTLLECAVHRGFAVLDTLPFVISALQISAADDVHVVPLDTVPNPAWLHSGIPSAGQQAWGAALMRTHAFVVLPSVASRLSWNLVFSPERAAGRYRLHAQQRLGVGTRLNPAAG